MMVYSPLRYPGGKARLFPFFANLIKANNLFGMRYVEPYAGGAGLALQLLEFGFVGEVIINDFDPTIYAFWHSVLNRPEDFCRRLMDTPITLDEWSKQRDVWLNADRSEYFELGFATYFLNRTNRSGIIAGAGPIGGKTQSGIWKIDARLNKESQINNIRSLARISHKITAINSDAMDILISHVGSDDTILYLDPPYFVKGRELYTSFYRPSDHFKIANFLKQHRSAKWVVSYDDVQDIRCAYDTFYAVSYNLNYSAGPKSIGSEVIFLSDPLSSAGAGVVKPEQFCLGNKMPLVVRDC